MRAGSQSQGRPFGINKISAWSYEMFGHVKQTVDKYIELSGKSRDSLKLKAATPCIDDHQIPSEEFDVSSLEWALPSPPKYHTFEEVPGIKVTNQMEYLKARLANIQKKDCV